MLSLKSMFCTLFDSAWMRMLWYDRGNEQWTSTMDTFWSKLVIEQPMHVSVADPDRQIRGRPGHPCLEIGEEPGLNFFSALRASVWSKNEGEPGPPGPLPWICHWICVYITQWRLWGIRWSIFQSDLHTWWHSTYIARFWTCFELVRGLLPRNSQIRQHKGLCDPCQNKFLQDNWILHLTLRRSWSLADHSLLVSLLDLKTQYYLLNKVKNDVTDHTCWELELACRQGKTTAPRKDLLT